MEASTSKVAGQPAVMVSFSGARIAMMGMTLMVMNVRRVANPIAAAMGLFEPAWKPERWAMNPATMAMMIFGMAVETTVTSVVMASLDSMKPAMMPMV